MNESPSTEPLEEDAFTLRVLAQVKAAGQAGIVHGKLVTTKKKAEKKPQDGQLADLVETGKLVLQTKGKTRRYWLAGEMPQPVKPEELAYEVLSKVLPEQKRGRLLTLAKIRDELLKGKGIKEPALRTCLRVLEKEKLLVKLLAGTTAYYAYVPALKELLEQEALLVRPEPLPETPAQRAGKPPGTALAVTTQRVIEAYKTVRMHRRMPDVEIVRLQEVLQCTVERLKPVVVQLCEQGVFIPGKGDWSFASPAARAASILIHNEPYLFVRMKE